MFLHGKKMNKKQNLGDTVNSLVILVYGCLSDRLVIVMESMWPVKPKLFINGPLEKMFANLCYKKCSGWKGGGPLSAKVSTAS